MAVIDVSRQRWLLLQDSAALELLPSEIITTLHDASSTRLLDAVAEAALIPTLTERIFVYFENIFPDVCARWISTAVDDNRKLQVASSLARLLPFAPYLSNFIASHATIPSPNHPAPLALQLPNFNDIPPNTPALEAQQILLTAWRLISFDLRIFRRSVSAQAVQVFFKHPDAAVRYLAVRIFCSLLRASDLKLETLIKEHVGEEEAVMGDFDGKTLDYGFLSLHEHDRAKHVISLQKQAQQEFDSFSIPPSAEQTLTPFVASYGTSVLPRPFGPSGDPSTLVMTDTTKMNLESLAGLLRTRSPVLLHGLPGSGKTSLIHEVAKDLGMYSSMVTLHLNEQTDAKMLIGLYSTDSKPGSFQWRAGVLTTAVKEGRWVLVEDLDRAPTEVLSTLLPLIERNELLIPSRGEKIRAAPSFRLFATVRTAKGMNGRENLPSIVGMRFWQTLHTIPITTPEVEQVVVETYPVLQKLATHVLGVFGRLSEMGRGHGARNSPRSITLRDLLKWCRRLQDCLQTAGVKSGAESISDTTWDLMFLEALDCFVGSLPDASLAHTMGQAIAEELHLSKDRADHYMTANIPTFGEDETRITIGRTWLKKNKFADRMKKSKRPFARTAHAQRLLEQIAVAVKLEESVLLVGETGIGKTTVVQQLAEHLGHKLIAVNLSQQSEVGDLLGGFKPANARSLAVPLKEEFEDLFSATGISATKNQKYLDQVGKCFAKGQWARVSKLWKEAPKMFLQILAQLERRQEEQAESQDGTSQPAKRRKTGSKLDTLLDLRPRWDSFAQSLEQFDIQVAGGAGAFAFSFVEGNLVKALRNGDWVLLDEINLASPDTLESIADLLTGPEDRPSLLLSETGEIEKITAHPNFRIFGAMNPATDVGKRDLPVGIRSRFTELYVRSPDADLKDLLTIIKTYLGSNSKNDQAADDIARLYLNTKRMAEEKRLVDGANEVPHFSLRTLTRVLTYVQTISPTYGVRRAMFEGFSMGFLTLLSRESEAMLVPLIHHHLIDKYGTVKSLLSQAPQKPNDGKAYVKFRNKDHDRQYWLFQGEEQPVEDKNYIITPYVERNLLNLVRATSTRRFPILIQGPTSAGKTSMIEYLANFTGNKFVRINNHEHTDLQEYLGTYVSGADGKLKFQEGLLVQAMRKGHWIVLDELNLAPTDVLEALNRLLDDNRELLIPETQEVVRPHENFILFATQNPPGLYGGRKALSRAFRNRFLELHYDDIPEDELEFILQQRSKNTSPPDCRRIVEVYKELSRLRNTSRLFEQKDSFATLRDLFRWALRGGDTRQDIAAHGFMLLAERVRNEDERMAVKGVIEKVFKGCKIDVEKLYSLNAAPELKKIASGSNSQGVIWTHAMRRLYILVARALKNKEPVLLVGETGCGKTTVVQLLAEALQKQLHIVNAHQNTETGDLIGSQRPIRNRGAIAEAFEADVRAAAQGVGVDVTQPFSDILEQYKALGQEVLGTVPFHLRERIVVNEARSKALFEWSDGALVEAMKEGQFFLLDEISLADDSVLERLNSVLEPSRTLLLAEKGIDDSLVKAHSEFQFFATMNPGGDFGKKELSPALRNRFTEIWVPPLSGSDDIYQIVEAKLNEGVKHFSRTVIEFAAWFGATFRPNATTPFSVREILVWVGFINKFQTDRPVLALVHGAATVFIDSIGANPSALLAVEAKTVNEQRRLCLQKLSEFAGEDVTLIYQTQPELTMTPEFLSIGDFSIPRLPSGAEEPGFAFHAPTTRLNCMRVLRALQMQKPILLEGSPGVGKTTLVAALSTACGQPLTRINLSDQTDLMDLFGTDVPVEGAEAGNFAWRDAPFLQAMQKGEWVLLDEMNLASQSVLEGLNACLDHRGEVYISELDQVFKRHPDFRLFAAQNPHHQGGGRKGLPASFVNRFIVVYADTFTEADLTLIASHNFPALPTELITQLIRFISQMDHQLVVEKTFGAQGGPWEFNLRDTLRWLKLLTAADPVLRTGNAHDYIDIVVRQRFRTQRDREFVDQLYSSIMDTAPKPHDLYHSITSRTGQVGLATLERNTVSQPEDFPRIDEIPRLQEIESVMICVKQNIPCIISGPSGVGKTVVLEHVAAISGKSLVVFPINADVDTMDLIGGFEQADPLRELNAALRDLHYCLQQSVLTLLPAEAPSGALDLLRLLEHEVNTNEAIAAVSQAVRHLSSQVSQDSQVGKALQEASTILARPLVLSNPRFEWLDGIIVKALEAGDWLVLDNANMCNASVLDRLNSLLEPNGFLSINEHCGPGGEPRIVRPHPDFRIFLTTDPRYGELSRAMRNRSVEIFIDSTPPVTDAYLKMVSPIESSLQRYQLHAAVASQTNADSQVQQVALDHLLSQDLSLLTRYHNGIADNVPLHAELERSLDYLRSASGAIAVSNIHKMYDQLPEQGNSMPLNPLNNFAVSRLVAEPAEMQWVSACLEFRQQVFVLSQLLQTQQNRAQTAKLSSLTRLQRSLVGDRVAAVSKDSTVALAKFLSGVISTMENLLNAKPSSSSEVKGWVAALRLVACYIDRTVRLTNQPTFEEAEFQAHLFHGSKLLHQYLEIRDDESSQDFANSIIRGLDQSFASGFKLTTGLSMERLWVVFRPILLSSQEALSKVLRIEELATRFDTLRWKTNSALPTLSKALSTLQQSFEIAKDNDEQAEQLIVSLETVINSLEAKVPEDAPTHEPYLVHQFDALRQLALLRQYEQQDGGPLDCELMALSNLPSKSALMVSGIDGPDSALQQINILTATPRQVWDGKFGTETWDKLSNLNGVTLGSLALLEAEMPIFGRHLVKASAGLVSDPLLSLNHVLRGLSWHTIAACAPGCEISKLTVDITNSSDKELMSLLENTSGIDQSSSGKELLQSMAQADMQVIFREHLLPTLLCIELALRRTDTREYYSALAWGHFAVGLIKLYVPDKVFDPEIRPRMERDFHKELLGNLDDKLSALQDFEKLFTGRDVSTRIELLHEETAAVGPLPPEVLPVYRPEISELNKLQADFSNITNIAKHGNVPALLNTSFYAKISLDDLKQTRSNIARLLDRMDARFRAYQDLTMPAVNFLRCLDIGVSLFEAQVAASSRSKPSEFVENVPFFGGSSNPMEASKNDDKSFNQLQLMSTAVAVEGLENLDPAAHQSILQCFHFFYEAWKDKLEADRKAEEAKGSLYRFRGSAEDEEEFDEHEFNELFPVYDEENNITRPPTKYDDVRDSSRRVAEIHAEIFNATSDSAAAIRNLCNAAADQITKDTQDHPFVDRSWNVKMLPTILSRLDEKQKSLSTSGTKDGEYNFYAHANLPEVRQLVSLTHKIKARFRELQFVDEIGHMQPLADVIMACDDLFALVHSEPLAKILTKVEHLHNILYEWQFGGWASKVHGAPALYDGLTETIVRWRRLELSTWSKLFDMEVSKCKEDTKAWWFIAYEVVIAVPLSMVDFKTDLQNYAVSLVENLQLYFSTSIIGQFQGRLELLAQLRGHLDILTAQFPSLKVILDALVNFITFYRRYESTVREAIAKGRAPIEKSMKDVLLMASWKDTNINALKESAKRSHQKLFRLVRKFRAVLGQEMKLVIEKGLPDESHNNATSSPAVHETVSISSESTAAVNAALPEWLDSKKRLANVPQTVAVMRRIQDKITSQSKVEDLLQEFITDLTTSAAELRKETPTTPTEENKSLIKHLKTRKRKLFADTLRGLRQMGLKHNLGQDRLAEQDSMAKVFSSISAIAGSDFTALSSADYYFDKILDVLAKVRDALRDHSEDLTPAEVGRSVGFVEGILHLLLTQRKRLAASSRGLLSLQKAVHELTSIGKLPSDDTLMVRTSHKNWQTAMPWFENIMLYAASLVKVHQAVGGESVDPIVQKLDGCASRVRACHTAVEKTSAAFPDQFSSAQYDQAEVQLEDTLAQVEVELDTLSRENPSLAYILQSLPSWTRLTSNDSNGIAESSNLATFANGLATISDKILVAIERARALSAASPPEAVDESHEEWLTKQVESMYTIIDGLRMSTIQKDLAQCITTLRNTSLDSPVVARGAVAALAVVSPILDQYADLCQRVIEKMCDHHQAAAYLGFNLTTMFLQIATQGFCTPQEKSDETSGAEGKLESGTGLGDGDGAEDISKDIQPDEDLTELAQEANKEASDDVEDQKDAVDMADEELEGDTGSAAGDDEEEDDKKDGEEKEEEENEMDEEAGDVDDLDPTAVDEKMWDGDDDEEAEKDQQGDKSKGQKKDDEQMAQDDQAKKDDKKEEDQEPEPADNDKDDENEEADEGEDAEEQDENVEESNDMNRQDQNVDENDALALPEEMDLDLDLDEEASDSDDQEMNELSDVEDGGPEEEHKEEGKHEDELDEGEEEAGKTEEGKEEPEVEEEGKEEEDEEMKGKDDGEPTDEVKDEEDEEPEAEQQEQIEPDTAPASADQGETDLENAAESDVKGSGEDQNAESMELDDQFQSNAANQSEGKQGDGDADQAATAGKEGEMSRSNDPVDGGDQEQEMAENSMDDPFKKLGDALERWHRQKSDLKQANKEQKEEEEIKQDPTQTQEQAKQEFQHLQNDDDAADAQAMGTADDDQVQPIDENMGIDDEKEDPASRLLDEASGETENEAKEADETKDDEEEQDANQDDKPGEADDDPGRSGVQTRQGKYQEEEAPQEDETMVVEKEADEEIIEETSEQLSSTYISEKQRVLRDYEEAGRQWAEFQSNTHALSLSLTSQLRLILTPSQTTKLSGSFRTGKRLNIKRIIPYIASSYKRDKIWMRRSIPTKRSYQILLCVDDSKSMGESSSGKLAMQSLVMVSRSLTMLEAGQVGVLGFGGEVFPAHSLTEPFGSDAGAKILQNFNFSQDRTDVALLIRQTIDTFKEARQQQSGGSDLWQLALILSDGLTPSSTHDEIRRLLREAIEERIMIVFIIMDDTTGKRKGDSVLELNQVKFVNGQVLTTRYLDTFPFQYYLIVHNLEDLPSALAGLLRTWFAEVNA